MPFSFSEADVSAFAAASGDRNPLHVDRDYARTTPFGDRVVHGSLLSIAALGRLGGALAGVQAIEVAFGGAVLVGEPVEAEVRESPHADAWQVRVSGRGRLLARVVARRERTVEDEIVVGVERPMREEPFELAALPEVGETVSGAYAAGGRLAAIAAAHGAEALAPALLEALAWASYVVGMELPGLHGVFAATRLSLTAGGGGAGGYALRVADRDPRTEHLVLAGALEPGGGGRVAASIEAFARPAVPALDVDALFASPAPAPSGRAVVVVGGSRGFGGAVALGLVGRGHETHVVHSSAGAPLDARLVAHRADAGDPAAMTAVADAIRERGLPLHGLVLAASPPPMPMAVTTESARAVADYVASAVRLAAAPLGALMPLLEPGGFVLFCSSSAVSSPPRDWPHYVAAKSALEGLAAWTAVAVPGMRSVAARLPKMLTAMTNSPSMRVSAAAPEPVALRLIGLLDDLPPGFTLVEEELA